MITTRTATFRVPFMIGATFSTAVSLLAIDAGLYAGQDDREVSAVAIGSTVADLITEHNCWSGEAPSDMVGKVPRHVVVTVRGEARYAGSRMVGRALEQVFDGVDHGIRVHAFCR